MILMMRMRKNLRLQHQKKEVRLKKITNPPQKKLRERREKKVKKKRKKKIKK
jgi:hypothetical protein